MGKYTPEEIPPPEREGDVFSSSSQSRMDLLISDESVWTLETGLADEDDLNSLLSRDFKTRIAIVCQRHSWSTLQVSRSMFKLFTTLASSMNEVWDLARSFRSQTSDVELALSTCSRKLQNGRHEIAYIFKYPRMKIPGDESTWVIQQNGVYHQYDMETKQNTWMLFFPNCESYSSEKIIGNMKGQHPLQPHLSFHFANIDQWRWYMVGLEKEFHELADDILNLEIEEKLEFATMYEQMSTLRYIEKRLSPLIPIFAAHHRVLSMLKRMNGHLLSRGEVSQSVGSEFAVDLESLHAKVQSFDSNARYLLSRITGTIQMASDTISLKSQNITEGMSHHMLRDSTAIKVITIVTLVYLPASFVASFFGMGFFTIGDDGNGTWRATPYTWLYLAVALPMTALTLAYWKWKSRHTESWTSPV